MAQADSKNNRNLPTEAELARAFDDMEASMYDLQNMASVCSAIAEDGFHAGAKYDAPEGMRAVTDDSYRQMMFCIDQIEKMIGDVSARYFAQKFPNCGKASVSIAV